MKRNILTTLKTICLVITGLLLLGGCGGGGSAPPATVVSGTAVKGPVKSGTVKIYGVSSIGERNALPLATVQTDVNGRFTANIGSYSGALVAEVSGVYTDEATGEPVEILASSPLRAAVALVDTGANNNRKIAVTPLTSLACGLLGTTYTAPAITAANDRVGDLFKIRDIVGTQPVQPDVLAMGKGDDNQQTYTMALATLSQMGKDTAGGAGASYTQIEAVLDSFKSDLGASGTGGLAAANVSAFNAALSKVSTTLLPGFELAAANLGNAGTTTFKLTVEAAAVPAGTQLGALHGIITVPPGFDVRTFATGQVLDGLITAAGVAATGSPQLIGNYNSTTRQLSFDVVSPAAGFGAGACAVITFDVSTGTTAAASNFTVTSAQGKDYTTAATVSGVSISLK